MILVMLLGATLVPPSVQSSPTGTLGTAVEWEADVDAAVERAQREGKLILVLHVAGHFDRPERT